MFDNAWRLERDLFFSPVMNGVDWKAVHDSYRKLLPLAGSREDLNYLIGQMLGEMGNSHTYVGGGDDGDTAPRRTRGLLGVDFALDPASGRYRFATIYPGDNTRDDYRSPLAQPGLNVKAGDLPAGGQRRRAAGADRSGQPAAAGGRRHHRRSHHRRQRRPARVATSSSSRSTRSCRCARPRGSRTTARWSTSSPAAASATST